MKIFVNGTFDILHLGHIALLRYAKSLGSELIVAIDSDRRVTKLKGEKRPINSEKDRSVMLLALKPVDKVYVFDNDDELINLIKQCDIMVKGSDYKDKTIVGADFCNRIEFFERIDGYSTTKAIQNIIDR